MLYDCCDVILYLAEHLVVLNVIDFTATDLSFQRVLIELTTDIHQQCGWTGIDITAQRNIVHVTGNMNSITQDNTHKQPWWETETWHWTVLLII